MKEITEKYRVAAVQAAPVLFNAEATVNKACKLIRQAADMGARLAVFPEGFIPGYPFWLDIYTPTNKKAQICYKKLFASSLEVPGPEINVLCDIARETNMVLVMGICERRPKTTGTLYNSQVFIDNHGTLLGVRRKLVPTLKERVIHCPGNGELLPIYETELGRIGGLICGENSNQLAKFALMAQNQQIHAASWPAYFSRNPMREVIELTAKALAYENKVFVVNAAGVHDESNLEAIDATINDFPTNIFELAGGSSIIGPTGKIIAGPLPPREDILCCEINLDDIIIPKMVHDFSGHYNRFDVFSFRVNYISPSVEIEIGPKVQKEKNCDKDQKNKTIL